MPLILPGNVASAIGLNPDFAMAIMGMESSFGTAKNLTSTKGAKGIMQVMPDTFDQMKAWYTNPANIKKYNHSARFIYTWLYVCGKYSLRECSKTMNIYMDPSNKSE